MVETTERLRRLRTWFAVYFVFQSVVCNVVSVGVA